MKSDFWLWKEFSIRICQRFLQRFFLQETLSIRKTDLNKRWSFTSSNWLWIWFHFEMEPNSFNLRPEKTITFLTRNKKNAVKILPRQKKRYSAQFWLDLVSADKESFDRSGCTSTKCNCNWSREICTRNKWVTLISCLHNWGRVIGQRMNHLNPHRHHPSKRLIKDKGLWLPGITSLCDKSSIWGRDQD